MFSLVRETGAALVLVTHDPALAARADRRVQVDQGRLLAA
jgi:putative ABC transport system ATP-binding protein